MLVVSQLGLIQQRCQLLADINFSLAEGGLLALVGPNGAGKSSLLRSLAGLWPLAAGAAELGGQNLAAMPLAARAQRLAWLGQHNQVAFDFTVAQVVRLGAKHSSDDAVNSALAQFGMAEFAARAIHQLSGGQQQRVHLARVFLQLNAVTETDAQCLLLDEPLNGLDLGWQQQCLFLVKQWLQQRPQRCAVVALHDIGLAASFSDQMLVLNKGKMAFHGSPTALTEALLSQVWQYPIAIQRHETQTLVYAKAEG